MGKGIFRQDSGGVDIIGQLDLFGNVVEAADPQKRIGSRKYKTMQQLHGVLEGKNCKTCTHCVRYRYHNKTYYKCELWYVSNSEATDIRLKTVACKKYEEKRQ